MNANLIEIRWDDPKFEEAAKSLCGDGYPDHEQVVMVEALKSWVEEQVNDLMEDLSGNALAPRTTLDKHLANAQRKHDKLQTVN